MDKQTRRIMRDLGVNLRIVHKNTNMSSLYTDFVAYEFPEDYAYKLATAPSIETIVHVVATLQHKMKWKGRTILLVGTLPVLTTSQKNAEKPHMVKPVEPGTAIIGHELGTGLKEGDVIDIDGNEFKIAKIMSEYGGIQDVQLVLDLHDAQRVLGKEGKINQIMALNCKCKGDRLSVIRKELEGVLKDTKVTEFKTKADAREKQRDLVAQKRQAQLELLQTARDQVQANCDQVSENHAHALANYQRVKANRQKQETVLTNLVSITTPLVVVAAAVFVGLMTWTNVRERRTEIGLLRALGKGTGSIVGLFLGKALLVGSAGGLIGCGLGYLVAMIVSPGLGISGETFLPDAVLLGATLVGAPLVAAIASFVPTRIAVNQDPAVVLMDS
ncbi:MAG: FtsX-like permease family protein [Planctomycetes bacterium]|nr:FtsX-like permease family protein [Planctomycetota bacterium]